MEIVIETVLDHRADGDLRAGKERLHGFGKHMGAIVADEFKRAGLLTADKFDFRVALDGVGEIDELPVERHRDGALGQRGRDRLCDLQACRAGGKLALGAIGESHGNHQALLGLTRRYESA